MRILIFIDDLIEGDMLKSALSYTGLETVIHAQLQPTLETWPQNSAELIVLAPDSGAALPEQIAEVRAATSQVPLLILADHPTETQICEMLQAGADLVLPRPVSSRMLMNYAQVLLRRVETIPSFTLPSLELDDITLNPATRTVILTDQEEPISLTHLEFRLLYILMTNRQQVVPAEIIIERVWGYDGTGDRELLRGLVSRLRRKLEPDTEQPRFIQTIPGVGYAFDLEEI